MATKGSKRIREKTLVNYAKTAGLMGIPLGVLLFALLFSTGVVELKGNYTANTVCGGDVVCYLEMEELCFNNDVFVYPMEGAALVNARPTDSINEFRLYRGWGSGWREIKMNETCKGTWCGGKSGTNTNAYSFAFRKDKCYDIKIEVEKSLESTVNWNINPSGIWKAQYWYNGTNTTLKRKIGDNITQHNKTTQHTNVTSWKVKNCKECKYKCTKNSSIILPTPTFWCTETQYYNTTYYWNTSTPIYQYYNVIYPWNRTGVGVNTNNGSVYYYDCSGMTCSVKNNQLTFKGPFERGASWYETHLDECDNAGVPCEQLNISTDILKRDVNVQDADGVTADKNAKQKIKPKKKTVFTEAIQ